MDTENKNEFKLLNIIANSIGAKIVSWDNVTEALERKISFSIIVDASIYTTDREFKRIEQKSYFGDVR